MCGSFCVGATCVGFPQPPKLTLCVAGLCALDSQFPRSTLCVSRFVYTCFVSLPALFVMGVVCSSSSCAGRVVCTAQVCMPSHYGHPSPALCAGCVCLLGTWACPVYCLLARFICPITLATWDCPLCCKGCVRWLGLYATPLSVPKPAVCLGPQSMSC